MEITKVEKIYSDYTNQFTGYNVTFSDSTVMSVPLAEKNRHYQQVQEWIADGGVVIDNPPE